MSLRIPQKIDLREQWQLVLERRFDSADFADLLIAASRKLPEGTAAVEFGRVLWLEREEGEDAPPLEMERFETIRKTERIDGILPFTIPAASSIILLADELIETIIRLNMGVPELKNYDVIRDEIALAYFALFQNRPMRINYQLNMQLRVECAFSTISGQANELSLVGYLPLGGSIIIFFSAIHAQNFASIDPARVNHADGLVASRVGDQLVLQETMPKKKPETKLWKA